MEEVETRFLFMHFKLKTSDAISGAHLGAKKCWNLYAELNQTGKNSQ